MKRRKTIRLKRSNIRILIIVIVMMMMMMMIVHHLVPIHQNHPIRKGKGYQLVKTMFIKRINVDIIIIILFDI